MQASVVVREDLEFSELHLAKKCAAGKQENASNPIEWLEIDVSGIEDELPRGSLHPELDLRPLRNDRSSGSHLNVACAHPTSQLDVQLSLVLPYDFANYGKDADRDAQKVKTARKTREC